MTRPNRRWRAAAALVAATLFATACSSGQGSPAPGTTPGQPQTGGTLIYATDVEPTCWDLVQQSTIGAQTLLRNVLDSLVRLTPDGEFHGWLAEKWEISEDGRTYTFTLRPDMKFHDGTPLNAEAIRVNIQRWIDAKVNLAPSVPFESMQAVDERTLTIQLTESYAPLLQILSMPLVAIVSPASLQQNTPEQLCAGGASIVGSGPFKSGAYVAGQSWTLERNEDYAWASANADHQGAAYLQSVQVNFVPENSTRVGSLTAGQSHLVSNVPPNDVAALKTGGRTDVLTASAPGVPFSLHPNNATGVFADQAVREALRVGVDYETIVTSFYKGLYPRAWSLLTPATANAYDASLEGKFGYDAKAAIALLEQAGWNQVGPDGIRVRDGQRLEARWIINQSAIREQRDVLGEAIQDAARAIGMDLKRETLDPGTFSKRIQSGDYELADTSQSRAEGDMLNLVFRSTRTPDKGGINYTRLNDATMDQLLTDGARSMAPAARKDAYVAAQQLISDRSVAIPVYTPTYLLGTSNKVHGVHFDAPGVPWSFHDVWLAAA